eukprot:gnl/TRDRNA2_/TRDRNA2_193269_c0_seq1.p1 gnl/TRDRNA2_/TRDRNA2_193269_c0~~gnl/TRDRNA2_/TRDRNA2_193269_c0_seq1.p1  ORF type:complete len:213 (-),score=10.07 gnl/TRDRNA2_/TRDRNA2_193269_c0_seq1:160-798(-)
MRVIVAVAVAFACAGCTTIAKSVVRKETKGPNSRVIAPDGTTHGSSGNSDTAKGMVAMEITSSQQMITQDAAIHSTSTDVNSTDLDARSMVHEGMEPPYDNLETSGTAHADVPTEHEPTIPKHNEPLEDVQAPVGDGANVTDMAQTKRAVFGMRRRRSCIQSRRRGNCVTENDSDGWGRRRSGERRRGQREECYSYRRAVRGRGKCEHRRRD